MVPLDNSFSRLDDSAVLHAKNGKAPRYVASAATAEPKITPFTGLSEDETQFSIWLRRLDNVIRMRPSELTSEQKANFFTGQLDGVALEKVEEKDEEALKSFDAVTTHLRNFFESRNSDT
uniref:Gag-protease polyprotein n=1 Tax=Haemonchus contortus TaxID=6289 RepID=A0A7I4YVJ1_HAECO